jgi:pyruvate/2-oxoglutarate dehydrogenase complex dihydrolipoamide dehydrogenase (E3) component
METYDHIIIGTGQAAGTLLGKLIPEGGRIAVIEASKVGGSCVNYGCTPTKTMVASAKAYHMAQRGRLYGFNVENLKLDYEQVRSRMNDIRNEARTGLRDWLEETENVELIRGHASFIGARQVKVGEQELEGRQIYINVGTRPRIPDIAGLESVPWMDSARLLDKKELPAHLIIIGGGYIGVEYAQAYRRFGSEVTLVQADNQLLPKEDEDVASAIREILEEEGVKVICNTKAASVSSESGQIRVVVEINGVEQHLQGSDLLVATGRIPNSDRLCLEAAGIKMKEDGFISVDDYCQTNVEGVFALGDVNGEGAFTHTSVNDAEIVLDHLYGGPRKLSDRIPVYALFTDPPLGRVGMSEKEALASGKRVLKADKPMKEISRAKEMGQTKGFAKLLVDADTDLILGASILGVGGDEIINMFAAIMHSGIKCYNYRRVVLVHPTVSELMPWILDGIRDARAEE